MTESLEHYSTKSDFAYALVRDRIMTNEYTPGTVLNQAELARALGISTTPLREALRRLGAEGLVELDAHRDAHITDLSAEEARDLLELRRALDPLAAAFAADRRTRQDLGDMRAALADMEPRPGAPAIEDFLVHRRFHRTVYCASHNDLLISTLDGMWDKVDRYRRIGAEARQQPHDLEERRREHQELFAAIVAGDAPRAERVMHDHIRGSLGATATARRTASPAD